MKHRIIGCLVMFALLAPFAHGAIAYFDTEEGTAVVKAAGFEPLVFGDTSKDPKKSLSRESSLEFNRESPTYEFFRVLEGLIFPMLPSARFLPKTATIDGKPTSFIYSKTDIEIARAMGRILELPPGEPLSFEFVDAYGVAKEIEFGKAYNFALRLYKETPEDVGKPQWVLGEVRNFLEVGTKHWHLAGDFAVLASGELKRQRTRHSGAPSIQATLLSGTFMKKLDRGIRDDIQNALGILGAAYSQISLYFFETNLVPFVTDIPGEEKIATCSLVRQFRAAQDSSHSTATTTNVGLIPICENWGL